MLYLHFIYKTCLWVGVGSASASECLHNVDESVNKKYTHISLIHSMENKITSQFLSQVSQPAYACKLHCYNIVSWNYLKSWWFTIALILQHTTIQ